MTTTSIRFVGTPVSYTISDLAAISQQIPVPATAVGNTLFAFIASNETTAANNVTAVTDSASNTWSQRGSTQSSGSGAGHVATQVYATTGGATASITWFKITPNANLKQVAVTFVEVAGLTATPVDANNGGTATAATAITPTNTPTQAGDLVFMYAATGGQSLVHVTDGMQNIDMVGAPYSAGTAGAGVVSSLVAFVGYPNQTATSNWSAASSTNFAWSTISLKAAIPGTGGLTQIASGDQVSANDINQLVNLMNGLTTSIPVKVSNRIQAALFGSVAQSGYCGATTSGAPVSGTFLVGDFVVDQTGFMWVCITGGSPGTWSRVGVGNYVARAYQAAPQSFAGDGAPTFFPVTVDTATGAGFDPKGMWSAVNHGFVIPFSGARWRVITGQHVGVTGNGRFIVGVSKNGTEICRGYDGPTVSGSAGGICTDIQAFSAGDIIRPVIASTVPGNTIGLAPSNFLCIALADS